METTGMFGFLKRQITGNPMLTCSPILKSQASTRFPAARTRSSTVWGAGRSSMTRSHCTQPEIQDPDSTLFNGSHNSQIPSNSSDDSERSLLQLELQELGSRHFQRRSAVHHHKWALFSKLTNLENTVPGPGNYSTGFGISKEGKYFNSKFHSSKCRSFSKSARATLELFGVKNPGPGQYRLPSEFGYYESKQNYNNQHSRVKTISWKL